MAAVHAGETLIKRPPAAKAVQSNMAAVHAGETLIKRPPAAKVVQTNMAAVHAGETLIKWPPAAKVVQTNMAAVHAGETLIKWPPACEGGAVQHGGGACRRNADQTAADGLDLSSEKSRRHPRRRMPAPVRSRASQRRGLRRLRPRRRVLNRIASRGNRRKSPSWENSAGSRKRGLRPRRVRRTIVAHGGWRPQHREPLRFRADECGAVTALK